MEAPKPKNLGGRPRLLERKKRRVTMWLDPDVFRRFAADGPGHLTRMSAVLADWAKKSPPPRAVTENAKPGEHRV